MKIILKLQDRFADTYVIEELACTSFSFLVDPYHSIVATINTRDFYLRFAREV